MNNAARTRARNQSFFAMVLHDIFQLIVFSSLGAIFFLVRYMLRTPQPLKSGMRGEERLFAWSHGHVFYKVMGEQDAPPLVLLHSAELASSSYEMRGLMEPLAQHYRVYAMDLLGFGLSDHPHIRYTGELYVELLRDFLVNVVERPATLVASGLSANYAIALASSAPRHCERLVLLSPTSLFANGKVRHWYTPLLHNALLGLSIYAFLTTRIVLQAILTRGTARAIAALSADDLRHYFATAHQFGAEHPVLASMTGALSLDVSQQLEALQQPLLVIWGLHAMQRALHSPEAFASLQQGTSSPLLALTDSSMNATNTDRPVVLLPDAGLHIQEEQPARVVSLIQDWAINAPKGDVPPQEFVAPNDYKEQMKTFAAASSPSLTATRSTQRIDTDELEAIEQQEAAPGVIEEALSVDEPAAEAIEAYCVKCKQKRTMSNPTDTTTKNGRRAKEGTCPVCATRLFRFVAS